VQLSAGFTRRGLEGARVPRNVMARLALKAPAFWRGPALRAGSHLGLSGTSAPEHWNPAFGLTGLDMVLSVHGMDELSVCKAVETLRELAQGMRVSELPPARVLDPPRDSPPMGSARSAKGLPAQWVHFGYRDGLSRIGIEGWTERNAPQELLPSSRHKLGEFVLGHVADSGADPWVAGPGLRVWPDTVRSFFHNGSFGVLQQIVQDVDAFEDYVSKAAKRIGVSVREVKGKLCGRYPEGQPLAVPGSTDPTADFDYSADLTGVGCPFGSHVRRMNPRLHRPRSAKPWEAPDRPPAAGTAHFSRARPLLRRGLPYGPAAWDQPEPVPGEPVPCKPVPERGLIGHFFCASIEDQFEHLLGEWGDRVPLGSDDRGGARDPLIGAHERRDGRFEIPQPSDARSVFLRDLRPFVRTAGAAYLFYPSLTTLSAIARSELWREVEDEE
jgi:deferrochelatase/peroxidase EfeB